MSFKWLTLLYWLSQLHDSGTHMAMSNYYFYFFAFISSQDLSLHFLACHYFATWLITNVLLTIWALYFCFLFAMKTFVCITFPPCTECILHLPTSIYHAYSCLVSNIFLCFSILLKIIFIWYITENIFQNRKLLFNIAVYIEVLLYEICIWGHVLKPFTN